MASIFDLASADFLTSEGRGTAVGFAVDNVGATPTDTLANIVVGAVLEAITDKIAGSTLIPYTGAPRGGVQKYTNVVQPPLGGRAIVNMRRGENVIESVQSNVPVTTAPRVILSTPIKGVINPTSNIISNLLSSPKEVVKITPQAVVVNSPINDVTKPLTPVQTVAADYSGIVSPPIIARPEASSSIIPKNNDVGTVSFVSQNTSVPTSGSWLDSIGDSLGGLMGVQKLQTPSIAATSSNSMTSGKIGLMVLGILVAGFLGFKFLRK